MGKKSILLLLGAMLLSISLAGCGKKTEATFSYDAADGKIVAQKTEDTEDVVKTTQETKKIGQYVQDMPEAEKKGQIFCGWYVKDEKINPLDLVEKDMDLQAKWIKEGTKIKVSLDKNDGSGKVLDTLSVKAEDALTEEQLPIPERKGYYFAGWQTRSEVTEDDLIGGVSKYMYYAGDSKSPAGIWNTDYASVKMPVAQIENLTADNEATLYARWVKIKEIHTEEELSAIRNDLYGAYQLADDITLTKDWTPIGSYYGAYELLNSNWWIHSFHGYFDGNGKTIDGLHITSTDNVMEEGNNVIVEEGDSNRGTAALFGSISKGAVVKNFTLSEPTIQVEQEGTAMYVAPVVGFMMGGELTDVTVENATIQATAKDTKDSTVYPSVSALTGGFWDGNITGCSATGSVTLDVVSEQKGVGEIYFGALSGECFATIKDSSAQCQLALHVTSVDSQDAEMTNIYAGGITGSNCYMENCKGNSDLQITVDKKKGGVGLNAALGVGCERYGYIRNVQADGTLTTVFEGDTASNEAVVKHQGSILGGFDTGVYASVGAMFNPALKVKEVSGCTTNNAQYPYIGMEYKNSATSQYKIENNTTVQE